MNECHEHEGDVGFPVKKNEGVICTHDIMESGAPVRAVIHHLDGDWEFNSGPGFGVEDLGLYCLGCLIERHPNLKAFSDLPKGWVGWRENDDECWEYEEVGNDAS